MAGLIQCKARAVIRPRPRDLLNGYFCSSRPNAGTGFMFPKLATSFNWQVKERPEMSFVMRDSTLV